MKSDSVCQSCDTARYAVASRLEHRISRENVCSMCMLTWRALGSFVHSTFLQLTHLEHGYLHWRLFVYEWSSRVNCGV